MAVQALLTRAGRKVFKDAKGRFISRARYELEQRRGPGGRFISKSRASQNKNIEAALRAELGAPPAGKEWFTIAAKYPERFADYVSDYL